MLIVVRAHQSWVLYLPLVNLRLNSIIFFISQCRVQSCSCANRCTTHYFSNAHTDVSYATSHLKSYYLYLKYYQKSHLQCYYLYLKSYQKSHIKSYYLEQKSHLRSYYLGKKCNPSSHIQTVWKLPDGNSSRKMVKKRDASGLQKRSSVATKSLVEWKIVPSCAMSARIPVFNCARIVS